MKHIFALHFKILNTNPPKSQSCIFYGKDDILSRVTQR
jgi:hypothetical protein